MFRHLPPVLSIERHVVADSAREWGKRVKISVHFIFEGCRVNKVRFVFDSPWSSEHRKILGLN